jgi:TusA-related sulfurtransferase
MMQDNVEHDVNEMSHEHFLDITAEVCPMTFVRAKLLIERMGAGETALIYLNAGEPLDNVPRSIREHGHLIISIGALDAADPQGRHFILMRKT